MRNYKNIDRYLDELSADIYAQPFDEGHLQMAKDVFNKWVGGLDIENVLDIGCGAGAIVEPLFKSMGATYFGISLGSDVVTAQFLVKNVLDMDMSFMEFDDNSFDLLWARHVLEHSPFPLLTLMEWHRVSKKYLCLILPNPNHFTYVGRNHYSVMEPHQAVWLLRRAGWQVIEYEVVEQELRFLCDKQPRISYEGFAEVPISQKIHLFEQEMFK